MTAGRRAMVTGASGFVGSHIVVTLHAAGWHVIAQDRSFDADLRARWPRSAGVPIELLEEPLDTLPPMTLDAVVHAAAVTAGPNDLGQTPEENFRANMDPLLVVVAWAAQSGVGRVIFLSSSAVYRATEPGPVSESLPASPLGLYAVAKHAAEALLETLRIDYGRDVVTARLSNVYGPREQVRPTRPRLGLVGQMIQTALAEGRLVVYRDDLPRDWTYAPDIGRALLALLEAPVLVHAIYHVAAEHVLSPLEIGEELATILPGLALDVRSGVDPRAPQLTRRGYLQSERLRQATGFAGWTPFGEGLRETVAWQGQAVLAS